MLSNHPCSSALCLLTGPWLLSTPLPQPSHPPGHSPGPPFLLWDPRGLGDPGGEAHQLIKGPNLTYKFLNLPLAPAPGSHRGTLSSWDTWNSGVSWGTLKEEEQ